MTAPLRRPMPSRGWRGWVGPLAVTAIAAVLRLVDLGRPHAVVFDETYYVKDALALLRFGYEQGTIDAADDVILSQHAAWDRLNVFTDTASFVVHPPLGKWVIASGEWLVGVTPFGWRIGVAILGTLTVLMTARIMRRLTRSDVIGTVAGLLVALDGLHLVMSRTALLDMPLLFFILAGFGLLLLDRDAVLGRADAWRTLSDRTLPDHGHGFGPGFGVRPWRIAAGVALGLACGVKWSGLWYLMALGLLSVGWDVQVRRALGVRRPVRGALVRDAGPALLSLVGVASVVYLTTWTGWLVTDSGYHRTWAAGRSGLPWLPDVLRSLLDYHRAAWNFHVGLHSEHAYKSSAWSWPIMGRPTSFYYESDGLACGAPKCSAEVLALGNPIIWWAGLLALGHAVWRALAGRDWRSAALLVCWLAGMIPWLIFHDRTIFTFYAVILVPFMSGMLAMSLAALAGGPQASQRRRRVGLVAAGSVLLLVVVTAWFFYPVWTGVPIPYDHWSLRMWSPTWV